MWLGCNCRKYVGKTISMPVERKNKRKHKENTNKTKSKKEQTNVLASWIYNISTDIHQRSQSLRHLYPGLGLKLVAFGFSRNQNNRNPSGVTVFTVTGREDKTHVKRRMARKDRGSIGFAFLFACLVGKTPQTPQIEPQWTDDAITRGGIGGLQWSGVYLWTYFRRNVFGNMGNI